MTVVERRRRWSFVVVVAAIVLAAGATACEPVPTKPGTRRFVVLGDSVPSGMVRGGKGAVAGDRWTLIDGTLLACDGAKGNPVARSTTGAIVPTSDGCDDGWPKLYPRHLTLPTDVAVVMAGQHAMLDHRLDGVWRHPCHSPARTWYRTDIEGRLRLVAAKADRTVLVLPAWPTAMSRWIMPADYVARADCVRAVMKEAAKAVGVPTVDMGALLCPAGKAACNAWRSRDGIHLDPAWDDDALIWLMETADPEP